MAGMVCISEAVATGFSPETGLNELPVSRGAYLIVLHKTAFWYREDELCGGGVNNEKWGEKERKLGAGEKRRLKWGSIWARKEDHVRVAKAVLKYSPAGAKCVPVLGSFCSGKQKRGAGGRWCVHDHHPNGQFSREKRSLCSNFGCMHTLGEKILPPQHQHISSFPQLLLCPGPESPFFSPSCAGICLYQHPPYRDLI